jgi:hypothetical protein
MEPQSTQDATKRAMQILDAKYSKADLQSVVRDNCKHLSADQQKKLLQLLKKYESLFDGTLGDWKTKPASFQLKEGASPYHNQAFPVPKIHKDTLIKEVERLVKLGVLEQQPALEWASPLFITPKKNRTVHLLSNFWEVNKRLIRKPFPIPKISMVLQELEGFTFATALDLNMASTPLDWTLMHPESAPSSFLGGNIPTRDFRRVLRVLLTFFKVKCWS